MAFIIERENFAECTKAFQVPSVGRGDIFRSEIRVTTPLERGPFGFSCRLFVPRLRPPPPPPTACGPHHYADSSSNYSEGTNDSRKPAILAFPRSRINLLLIFAVVIPPYHSCPGFHLFCLVKLGPDFAEKGNNGRAKRNDWANE